MLSIATHAPAPQAPPSTPGRVLALDTSTERMSLALVTPHQVLTAEAEGGAQASATLVPGLLQLLAHGGCTLAALDAIAFGCGPGAFTGLRTACSVAQGLAFGANKPVLPVDSLMLVAESVREHALAQGLHTLWVVQDARMNEVYAGAYRWQGARPGHWQVAAAPALCAIDRLNERWAELPWARAAGPAGVGLVGSALDAMGEQLQGGGAPRLDVARGVGRARALATLAQRGWDNGALLDASHALPVYLRNKVALTTSERERARAAAATPLAAP